METWQSLREHIHKEWMVFFLWMSVGLSDYIHIFAIVVRPSGVERPADVLKIDVHAEFGTFAVTDVIYAGLLLVDAIGRLNAAEHGIRKASWVISHLARFFV